MPMNDKTIDNVIRIILLVSWLEGTEPVES